MSVSAGPLLTMAISENSLANLKPFQPGQSGNPSGRPKKKWLTELMEELLEEKLTEQLSRKDYKEHIWAKLNSKGVVSAMTLDKVWERTEGKMPTQVTVDGELNVTLTDRLAAARERKSKK